MSGKIISDTLSDTLIPPLKPMTDISRISQTTLGRFLLQQSHYLCHCISNGHRHWRHLARARTLGQSEQRHHRFISAHFSALAGVAIQRINILSDTTIAMMAVFQAHMDTTPHGQADTAATSASEQPTMKRVVTQGATQAKKGDGGKKTAKSSNAPRTAAASKIDANNKIIPRSKTQSTTAGNTSPPQAISQRSTSDNG